MKILSPMATGSGAYLIHRALERNINEYTVFGYNPYWSLFPPSLSLLANSYKADMIHCVPEYGYFVKRKNTPLIATFHSFVVDQETAKYSTFLQRIHHRLTLRHLIRKTLTAATRITAVSKFIADMIKIEYGYDKEIPVIYNGVDLEKFTPVYRKDSNKTIVLFSGNPTRRKGAHLLPKIASKLDNGIELLYTGGLRNKSPFPDRPNMRNLGYTPFSEMPSIYQKADILLFPTVREGFGLAAAEAMACGLPVVATNCSSLPELVDHARGGYLCKIEDVENFAKRINELAASPSKRHEMGEYNRTKVEKHFNIKQMVSRYNTIFTETRDSFSS